MPFPQSSFCIYLLIPPPPNTAPFSAEVTTTVGGDRRTAAGARRTPQPTAPPGGPDTAAEDAAPDTADGAPAAAAGGATSSAAEGAADSAAEGDRKAVVVKGRDVSADTDSEVAPAATTAGAIERDGAPAAADGGPPTPGVGRRAIGEPAAISRTDGSADTTPPDGSPAAIGAGGPNRAGKVSGGPPPRWAGGAGAPGRSVPWPGRAPGTPETGGGGGARPALPMTRCKAASSGMRMLGPFLVVRQYTSPRLLNTEATVAPPLDRLTWSS